MPEGDTAKIEAWVLIEAEEGRRIWAGLKSDKRLRVSTQRRGNPARDRDPLMVEEIIRATGSQTGR
jgi:hypothetical protein